MKRGRTNTIVMELYFSFLYRNEKKIFRNTKGIREYKKKFWLEVTSHWEAAMTIVYKRGPTT